MIVMMGNLISNHQRLWWLLHGQKGKWGRRQKKFWWCSNFHNQTEDIWLMSDIKSSCHGLQTSQVLRQVSLASLHLSFSSHLLLVPDLDITIRVHTCLICLTHYLVWVCACVYSTFCIRIFVFCQFFLLCQVLFACFFGFFFKWWECFCSPCEFSVFSFFFLHVYIL